MSAYRVRTEFDTDWLTECGFAREADPYDAEPAPLRGSCPDCGVTGGEHTHGCPNDDREPEDLEDEEPGQ